MNRAAITKTSLDTGRNAFAAAEIVAAAAAAREHTSRISKLHTEPEEVASCNIF